jgi:hypothetical protein
MKPEVERASGKTVAEENAADKHDEMDQEIDNNVLPEERELEFSTPGFSRMRTDWKSGDRMMLQRIQTVVQERLYEEFADAYAIMSDLYDIVRNPMIGSDGEPVRDVYGFVLWQRSDSGAFQEDWSLLDRKQQEHFIFRITTQSFEWAQRSADLWGEAMFAKAMWAESFAIEFDAPMSGSEAVRKARGDMNAAESRQFAIFVAYASRKADALLRSMELLNLRISQLLKM